MSNAAVAAALAKATMDKKDEVPAEATSTAEVTEVTSSQTTTEAKPTEVQPKEEEVKAIETTEPSTPVDDNGVLTDFTNNLPRNNAVPPRGYFDFTK